MPRNLVHVTGRMSRVMTDETVFVSDVVMAIVAANIEAITRPTSPTGRNCLVSSTYDCDGSTRLGRIKGAAHIGKNRNRGQIRYNPPESSADLRALGPEGAPM